MSWTHKSGPKASGCQDDSGEVVAGKLGEAGGDAGGDASEGVQLG